MEATKPKLTGNRVHELVLACLFKEGEDTSTAVAGEGINTKLGFHPDRLAQHAAEIRELLEELPDEFREELGGGYTFLNAPFDKRGNHWGEHPTVDELLCLGIATKQVAFLLPREYWNSMPGGVPYFVVLKKQEGVAV